MNKKHRFIYTFLTLLFVLSSAHALTLNLKNADIRTLINTVSQATGKNFIIDPRVRGKVNVVSNQDINDEKLYQFFTSILQVHGYVVISGDDFDKILPKNATKNTPPNHLAGDSIISVVLAVKNVEVKELIAILRPLTSQHGYLAAYQPSNSIIMLLCAFVLIVKLECLLFLISNEVNTPASSVALEFLSEIIS
jgi:general secretion pathway protein D